jgi:diadenosine tetraphosphate (Ap4A) HIT family hydrolase
MQKTIFERIIAREAPGSFIYEDDVVAVILTMGPVNPGHAMVIPKKPFVGLEDLDEETGAHIFRIAQRTAKAIRCSGLRCEGINLFLADGAAAFQEVDHFHLHVFPRFKGDPFRLSADWSNKPSRDELDRVASQIKRAYDELWKESRPNKPPPQTPDSGTPAANAPVALPPGAAGICRS